MVPLENDGDGVAGQKDGGQFGANNHVTAGKILAWPQRKGFVWLTDIYRLYIPFRSDISNLIRSMMLCQALCALAAAAVTGL